MDQKEMLMLAGGVLLVIFILYMLNRRSSSYTSESFDGMTVTQATEKFVAQTGVIATEMKDELKSGIEAGKTKDELVVISDKYSDYSSDLNKRYARFHIMNLPM
jgi:hypothetical protein